MKEQTELFQNTCRKYDFCARLFSEAKDRDH